MRAAWESEILNEGDTLVPIEDLIEVRTSPINGQGVFYRRDLPEEYILGEVKGQVIDDPEYDSDTCGWLDQDKHLKVEPDDTGVPLHRTNHSCEPSAYLDSDLADTTPRLLMVTARAVKAGEEVTVDYEWPLLGLDDNIRIFRCRCHAPTCKGWIVKYDDLQIAQGVLQQNWWYAPFASPTHGLGVHATRAISEGTTLGYFTGRVISVPDGVADASEHGLFFDNRVFVPNGGYPFHLTNYGCTPNIEVDVDLDENIGVVKSLRDIAANEELLVAHPNPPSFVCRCPDHDH